MKVFSGIQPTSQIHIGNYLGAIKQWLALQTKHDCIFCIVDLHALTIPYDPKTLKKRVLDIAIAYLAAGLNPKKSIIFVQSAVKEHAELCWLLSTVTPLGDLNRMTQFKEKSKKHSQDINAGLLNYPILMAADILLYQTDLVPVGIDQKQHVELTREIARRFNNKFGKKFNLPKVLLAKQGAKVMSLTEPTKKMSKSDSPQSFISLFDSPQEIKQKIASSQTDSGKEIKYDPKNKAGISNLLTIYHLFSEKPMAVLEKKYQGKGYKAFKKDLAKLLIKKLEPFRKKRAVLNRQTAKLEKVLDNGAKRAQIIASQTMKAVKKQMSL